MGQCSLRHENRAPPAVQGRGDQAEPAGFPHRGSEREGCRDHRTESHREKSCPEGIAEICSSSPLSILASAGQCVCVCVSKPSRPGKEPQKGKRKKTHPQGTCRAGIMPAPPGWGNLRIHGALSRVLRGFASAGGKNHPWAASGFDLKS